MENLYIDDLFLSCTYMTCVWLVYLWHCPNDKACPVQLALVNYSWIGNLETTEMSNIIFV